MSRPSPTPAPARLRFSCALSWCAVAAWFGVIWNFSAMDGAQSGALSDRLLFRLLSTLVPTFSTHSLDAQQAALDILSLFERKAAHMLLFFLLALLLTNALRYCIHRAVPRGLAAFGLTAVFAAADELHQLFVPARSGQFSDVLVDLAGAAALLLLFLLLHGLAALRRRLRKQPLGRRILLTLATLIPPAVCMALIFTLSAQVRADSSSLSQSVVRVAATELLPAFSDMDEAQQDSLVRSLNGITRKLAHFCIFFTLGGACMVMLALWGMRMIPAGLLSTLLCFLYACSDEYHQFFVDGRGAQFSDVLLDTAGAGCCIVLCLLLWSACLIATRLYVRPPKQLPEEG